MCFLQRLLVQVSFWWLLPVFLSIVPFWLVRSHRPVLSYITAVLPLGGLCLTVASCAKYARVGPWSFLKTRKLSAALSLAIVTWTIFLVAFCIPWALRGKTMSVQRGAINVSHKSWYLDEKRWLGAWWCVDLSGQMLVMEREKDFDTTYWAQLQGVHLEGANLTETILLKANLEDAHFQHALLFGANFRSSNLARADLTAVLGARAVFQDAIFYNTNFEAAMLPFANFKSAKLGQSNLQACDFTKSDFTAANIYNCKFRNSHLQETNFEGANLRSAKLDGACLTGANLTDTKMEDASLVGAYLFRTDLQGVTGLKAEQLCKAGSLWGAAFDSDLADAVHATCPKLLEKPTAISYRGIFECLPDVVVR